MWRVPKGCKLDVHAHRTYILCDTWVKQNRLKHMLEAVIMSYYRGTTQIDEKSTPSCTIIHADLITGSDPGDSYFDSLAFGSGHPRKSIQ